MRLFPAGVAAATLAALAPSPAGAAGVVELVCQSTTCVASGTVNGVVHLSSIFVSEPAGAACAVAGTASGYLTGALTSEFTFSRIGVAGAIALTTIGGTGQGYATPFNPSCLGMPTTWRLVIVY